MKKFLIPLILVAILAVGGYFLFFQEEGTDKPPTEEPSLESPDVSENTEKPSPEEIQKQKRLIEHARPQEFIDLRYSARKNVLGESIIEGSLLNNAELTVYKDIQMMIYFLDEEDTPLDSASQVIFKTLNPGEEVPFKMKEKGPRKTEVKLKIIEAGVFEK